MRRKQIQYICVESSPASCASGLKCILKSKTFLSPLTAYPNLIPYLDTKPPGIKAYFNDIHFLNGYFFAPCLLASLQHDSSMAYKTAVTSPPQQFSKQQGITWRSTVKLRVQHRPKPSSGRVSWIMSSATSQHGISSGSRADGSLPYITKEKNRFLWTNCGGVFNSEVRFDSAWEWSSP